MKRALRFVVPLALVVGIFAHAGPRPRSQATVAGAVPVLVALDPGWAYTMQCNGIAVQYRSVNAAEFADGGLGITPTDGGVFGVTADFRTNGDPLVVSMTVNQQPTEVGIALLVVTDAGPCAFSAP